MNYLYINSHLHVLKIVHFKGQIKCISKGVLECTKCLSGNKSVKVQSRSDSTPLALKLQERTVVASREALRKKRQGFSLGENYSFSHRQKGFSSPQFLQGTTLELDIKLHSISFPVPLCLAGVTHPSDLSSSTTSSRKFSLTLPLRTALLFYVHKTASSCAASLTIVILHVLFCGLIHISFLLTRMDGYSLRVETAWFWNS